MFCTPEVSRRFGKAAIADLLRQQRSQQWDFDGRLGAPSTRRFLCSIGWWGGWAHARLNRDTGYDMLEVLTLDDHAAPANCFVKME